LSPGPIWLSAIAETDEGRRRFHWLVLRSAAAGVFQASGKEAQIAEVPSGRVRPWCGEAAQWHETDEWLAKESSKPGTSLVPGLWPVLQHYLRLRAVFFLAAGLRAAVFLTARLAVLRTVRFFGAVLRTARFFGVLLRVARFLATGLRATFFLALFVAICNLRDSDNRSLGEMRQRCKGESVRFLVLRTRALHRQCRTGAVASDSQCARMNPGARSSVVRAAGS
jgi:hypothetical protein